MMMVHLELEIGASPDKVLKKATILSRKFGIYHSTI